MISCKNCGGHFTKDEVLRCKPPLHPWPLTAVGQQVATENQASGDDQWPCPACGCRTLRG